MSKTVPKQEIITDYRIRSRRGENKARDSAAPKSTSDSIPQAIILDDVTGAASPVLEARKRAQGQKYI